MEKNSLNKSILPGEDHPFKTKIFGLLIALFLIAKIIIAFAYPVSSSQALDLTTANIIAGINQQRSLYNLTQLNTNTLLTQAAQYKSDDMQSRHYFAHVDPDGHYIWDKIVALGYAPYLQLGENLAINFYDTDSLISAWMNSPEHRANILNQAFADQGMGVTMGDVSQNQYYSAIANTFGVLAPAVKAAAPAIPARAKPAANKPAAAVKGSAAQPPAAGSQAASASLLTLPATASTSLSSSSPVLARGAMANPETNFALPPSPATTTASAPPAAARVGTQPSASARPGNNEQTLVSDYQANRNLILAAAIALLLLMLVDIKKAVEHKLGALDKKTNNIVLLLITILVIAFMYWF